MSRTYRRTQNGKKARYLKHHHRAAREAFDKFVDENCRDENGKVNNWELWRLAWDHFWVGKLDHFYWMTTPSHWNNQYHTRPRRAKERDLLRKVLKDEVDAEDTVWPLAKKPHIYYW